MSSKAQPLLTTRLLSGTLYDDQAQLERDAIHEGVLRYRRLVSRAVEEGEGASLKPAERMLLFWFDPLRDAIQQELDEMKRGEQDAGRHFFGPVMLQLDADRMALITLRHCIGHCMRVPDGAPISPLAYAIGRDAICEIQVAEMMKHDRGVREREAGREAEDNGLPEFSTTRIYRELDTKFARMNTKRVNWWARKTLNDPVWNQKICVHLGIRLMWHLIGTASIGKRGEEFKLAFHHERSPGGRQRNPARLRMDEAVFGIIDRGHEIRQFFRPRFLPMVVPPAAWEKNAEGGYLRTRTPLISRPSRAQKDLMDARDMSGLFARINDLGRTPWRVNQRMLDVMTYLWESGGGVAGIPQQSDFPLPSAPRDDSPEALKILKYERAKIHNRNRAERSKRYDYSLKLDIARRMQDYERIYFPHQLDFRGRAYPIPLFLNHQGDDAGRALLEFAEPKEPGEQGYRWLKIHAANCWGFDKVPFDQRVAWIDGHMDLIRESARDPLWATWWQGAGDYPLQFLAACMALCIPECAAVLPVQLDGTCNGLQHYAAMTRDPKGAALVNLSPSDHPSDVYATVAESVKKVVSADAERGVAEAAALDGLIDRGVVKQPVMTSVYGVTQVGARQQLVARLEEKGIPDHTIYATAAYLAKVTLGAIGQTCEGAGEAMEWLRRSASEIAKRGHAVTWISPAGLPVVQNYRNRAQFMVSTIMGNVMFLGPGDETVPVNVYEQRNGFAPNFVHSIDASHMLMTCGAAAGAGIPFAAVHDCYWTRACDVETLSQLLRKEFVRLHSQDQLSELYMQLSNRYPDCKLKMPPDPGRFDLKLVMKSPYFFS